MTSTTNSKPADADPEVVVNMYFTAWTKGDVAGALACMTDDMTLTARNGEYRGEAGYRDFLEGFLRLLDAVEDKTILVSGDTAVIWYRYTTHLPGLEPQIAAEHIKLRDGRIARIEYLFDQVPFARALGSNSGADLHQAVNAR